MSVFDGNEPWLQNWARPSVVSTAYALVLKYHAGRRYLGDGKYAVSDDAERAAEALSALQRVWPDFVAIAEDEHDLTVGG
tara:strand:+ start:112 stop:351 length:240 start_codon:yes stop_codon:yes gene_type:complete